MKLDLTMHLERQRKFSLKAFGPNQTPQGVIDHIKKELIEIESTPNDIYEWVDLMLLAFDGAMRAGFQPHEITAALDDKLTINENRDWPDWRECDPNKAIEHKIMRG